MTMQENGMIKRIATALLILLLPMFLMSRDYRHKSVNSALSFKNLKSSDRSWRLNEVLEESTANSVWSMENKSVYIYHPSYPSKIDTLKGFAFNSDTGEWELSWRDDFTYDSTGHFLTQIIWYDNWTSEMPVSKISLQYNYQQRLTMITEENYDDMTLEWSLSSWQKIIYNAGSLNSLVGYSVSGAEGPAHWDRTIYTNDGQGRPILETFQASEDSVIWVNRERIQTTYHTHDTSTGNDFVEGMAHLYENSYWLIDSFFASIAIVTQTTSQTYDNGWLNNYRNNYSYNTQDKLIEQIDMNWNDIWVNDYQMTVSYYPNGNVQLALSSWWNGASWTNSYRKIFTWGQFTANDDNSIPAVNVLNCTASPNPFRQDVSILVSSKSAQPVKLAVYNPKGQLIKTISARTNSAVNWNGTDLANQTVACGVYYIKAEVSGCSKTTKVLKLK
jgi:hypothetical protein